MADCRIKVVVSDRVLSGTGGELLDVPNGPEICAICGTDHDHVPPKCAECGGDCSPECGLHPKGCMYGGFSRGYWIVADGCTLNHGDSPAWAPDTEYSRGHADGVASAKANAALTGDVTRRVVESITAERDALKVELVVAQREWGKYAEIATVGNAEIVRLEADNRRLRQELDALRPNEPGTVSVSRTRWDELKADNERLRAEVAEKSEGYNALAGFCDERKEAHQKTETQLTELREAAEARLLCGCGGGNCPECSSLEVVLTKVTPAAAVTAGTLSTHQGVQVFTPTRTKVTP